VLHAARWIQDAKITQKIAICAVSYNFVGLYIFAAKAFVDNQKKPVKQQYFLHMSSQRLRSVGEFGAPQQISTGFASWLRYCTNVAQRSSTKLCTMFGRLLGWYTVYTFWGLLLLMEFYQVQISLCVESCVLYWQRYCTALEQWASAKLCGVVQVRELRRFRSSLAPSILHRAAITLGIGPHSS